MSPAAVPAGLFSVECPVPRTHKTSPGRSLRPSPVLLIALGLAVYFGYHTIQGRHGLEARSSLINRASVLDTEIRALEAVRSRIERETALLSESNPDADFVEEIARDMLGFAKPGERIIVVRRR